MPIEDKLAGYVESHAPQAQSDDIRLRLARDSVARMTAQIEGLGNSLDQLQSDYAAGVITVENFEQIGRELDEALTKASAKLALFEAQKDRIQKIIANS